MAAPPPPSSVPPVGCVLAGRYRIVARIGTGELGAVYRAWDGAADRYVVVKIPTERVREPEVFLERFAREMDSLRRIDHPHVVPIVDDGAFDGRPFAVMPYLAGGSLALRRPHRDGSIQPGAAASLHRWLPDVAAAIDHLHALGYVHRDVTPDTILFDGQGRPLVGDFGLARVSDDLVATDPSLAATGTVLGTPDYMDPHVLRGGAPVPAGDQFALAVIVYEFLAGHHPITGETPAARMIAQVTQDPRRLRVVRPDLPRSVGEAVHRGLAKNPDRRFASCAGLAAAVLAEIAPPPPLRQRRLMCPACHVLIAADDRHGGRLGSCPRCHSPVWISPDRLALVIPADREPLPVAAGRPTLPPGPGVSAAADSLEATPQAEPSARAGRAATAWRAVRSPWALGAGAGIAAATLGLTLTMAPEKTLPPAFAPPDGGAAIEAIPAADPPVVAPAPQTGQAGDSSRPDGDEGPSDSPPTTDATAMVAEGTAELLHSDPLPSAPIPTGIRTESDEAVAARDQGPLPPAAPQAALQPRVGAVIDPADAVARELDVLFSEWERTIASIEECEATLLRLTPDFDRDQALVNDVESRIRSLVAEAEKRRGLADLARRGRDAVTAEQRTVESLSLLKEAQSLGPELEQHRREVMKDRIEFARLNTEIAGHYKRISLTLPTWVETIAPLDRDERLAALLDEVDNGRRLVEQRFKGHWTHLEARVIQLHLTATTADAATVESATIALVDAIEKAEAFLTTRRVDEEGRRRLLHYPRLHVGYSTYRLLAATDRPPRKLDEWLRLQDERVSARMAGKVLQGLHALTQGKLSTAAKHFDEFIKREPETIRVETIETPLPDGAVLSRGVYVPAIDDRLKAALHGEIAWFFAAAPAPHADSSKARKLIREIAGDSLPWQALRAEAELFAREDRWEDALAVLARAEQRAPLLMAGEIREQREAYENRRPYTLARKR